MMSELTRLHAEALRLRTIYEEHKDSDTEYMRRKAHLDLDRFLMENRDTAITLLVEGLQAEIDKQVEVRRSVPWYKKLIKGGNANANNNNSFN